MRLRVRGARHGGEANPDRPASRPRSSSDGGHPRGSPRDGEAGLTPRPSRMQMPLASVHAIS